MIKVDYANKICGNYKVIKKLPKNDKGRDKYLCLNLKTHKEKVIDTNYLAKMILRAKRKKDK